jgi:hypothetical protein
VFLDRDVDGCSVEIPLDGDVLGLVGVFLFELGFRAVFPDKIFDGVTKVEAFTFSTDATFFGGDFSSLTIGEVFSIAEASIFSGAKRDFNEW